ncbi:MAG: aspartate carbamoyltransferase catalytic subunit [Acidimicrobiales bacterium]|nr:aspartate carbamoyltransferase catalytic subunit [Acidimicrobiales bacterium]MYB81659.1 aspartate carbamoyltransferase catalytic subunit [Acidimicrobiales bacterium]MYI11482.1 aspartate carbamoyltransferase catalytic subunit [Acidimicrobiales bacterium]
MSGHLLTLGELGTEGIAELLSLTDRFVEVGQRPIPKVPALRGRTVATLFFEESTRTRLAFETAAKRLSADVLTFSASSSSLAKGESLRDTVETIEAMGVDAMVVRHRSSGVPAQVARWVGDGVSVLNGGDGWHAHPTQGLQDAYTLWRHFCPVPDQPPGTVAPDVPTLAGRRVGIVGDIVHSRVARSEIEAYTALGASIVLVAPPTLLPTQPREWIDSWLPPDDAKRVEITHRLDDVVGELDVVGLLRCQRERMIDGLIGSIPEYVARYGLTFERVHRLRRSAVVTHPGPMNRGIEIAGDTAEDLAAEGRLLVTRQVTYGVAVRMAALFRLIGSGTALGADDRG